MKKIILLLLISYSWSNATATDDKKNVKANLTAVTIYRNGAEMSHSAKASLVKGNNELVLENISSALDINSIQVNCNGNVTVMGVEFSADHLQNETKTASILMLEDSVANINRNLENTKTSINIINELMTVLKANKEIKGTQTGLSVAELIKMMDYYKTKSIELQNELTTLNQKQAKLTALVRKLNEQIREEEKKNTKVSGRIILQLNCLLSGNYDFTLTYVTPNASWIAFYDLRADNIISPLKLIYRAKIFQTTGIDWKQVKLSLSTSSPSQGGNAPIFKPWFLSYIDPVKYYNRSLSEVNNLPVQDVEEALQGRVAGVEVINNGDLTGATSQITIRGISSLKAADPLYIVNGVRMDVGEYEKINPAAIKSINVLKDKSAAAIYGSSAAAGGVILITLKDGLEDYISVSDKELNVTFDVDLPYDVPTNGKAQTAILKEYEVPATYSFYAAPKMNKDVFLLAAIPDWEKLNLLPGEANIILEGNYIGKSFIDPSSTLDTLNLTMGRDKRVVVTKEKLMDYSNIKFLGTNKRQTFTYEITVKNNKKDAINISVKDQYPVSQNKEVEVDLIESGSSIINKETGLLEWKVNLAPGEVKKIRFSYSVKYPKYKQLNLN